MNDEFVEKKVFIVEDNPVNQKVMQRLVKILGHQVIFTQDGFEAIAMAKEHKPDLVLMDIQLIGISGIDITRNMKNDEDLKHIPVIAVTASATAEDKEKIVRESGCDDYLAKPFTPKELSNKMEKYIPVKKIDF